MMLVLLRNIMRILFRLWRIKLERWRSWDRSRIRRFSFKGGSFRGKKRNLEMLSSIKTSKLTLSNKEWTTMGRPISTKLELLGKHLINLLTKNKPSIISISPILLSLTNRSPNSLPPTNSRTIRSSSYINTMLFLRRIIFSQSKIWSPNGSRKGKKGKIKEKRREIEGKK